MRILNRSASLLLLCGVLFAGARDVPVSLPDRPGNICTDAERLSVRLPEAFRLASRWEILDAEGGVVARGEGIKGAESVDAGVLPVGWYRVEGFDGAGKRCASTTAAVVKCLAVPVPADSPVCVDTANAWFTRTGSREGDLKRMASFASLAALAGVSGVRDRLTWAELEPEPGAFSAHTRYDDSAAIMGKAGLSVLQVFHGTPPWARAPRLETDGGAKRFPRDLRDSYRFCQAMAARYRGTIQAWEPWNEANIPGFGGHLIDEMCALQKASYLGFKSTDPDLTVCWNVFAGSGTKHHAQGVIDNVCWPYFDTYNNHSYSGVEQYGKEFATARAGACGKPLWISECGVHVKWTGEHGDLPDAEEVRQAQFVPKSYASTLFAGVSRHYFFILGNYCETSIQFGLLRHDLTPRRGYLALAAVGRLMAGAETLGRMTNGALRVYAFRAQPDGVDRDVLVAWADKGSEAPAFAQGLRVEALYDGYGRRLPSAPAALTAAPVFWVLPKGEAVKLKMDAALGVSPAPAESGRSQVVMQPLFPQSQSRLDIQAHQIEIGTKSPVPFAVYNFGDKTVHGTLSVDTLEQGWRVTLPTRRVCLRPMERQVLAAQAVVSPAAGIRVVMGVPVTLRGEFGEAGTSVLSFRLACEPSAVRFEREQPVGGAGVADRWRDNIVGGSKMTHAVQDGRMVFCMDFGKQDPWGYPRLGLDKSERPLAGTEGLMAEVEVLEGSGTLRAQFVEAGGAVYLCELPYNFAKGGRQQVMALFAQASWVGYSKPDPDEALTPAELDGVMIGINAKTDSRVRLAIGDVRWVRN